MISRRLLCHVLARHMTNMLFCACGTRLSIGVDDLRAANNQQQLRFQQLAVRCFPMRLCQHHLRCSLRICGTWCAMSSDARLFFLPIWRTTLDLKTCLDYTCFAALHLC